MLCKNSTRTVYNNLYLSTLCLCITDCTENIYLIFTCSLVVNDAVHLLLTYYFFRKKYECPFGIISTDSGDWSILLDWSWTHIKLLLITVLIQFYIIGPPIIFNMQQAVHLFAGNVRLKYSSSSSWAKSRYMQLKWIVSTSKSLGALAFCH